MIKEKINSMYKFLIKNRLTKPSNKGNKLLILATAPCVDNYFDRKSVQEQFADYDIACINYMIFYSKERLFQIHPKYLVLLDPCFYREDCPPDIPGTPDYRMIAEILEEIDWDCSIVTSVLADFKVSNPNIDYIRLSCFSAKYRKWLLPAYRRNWINMGIFNVIQGAIFFGIVFGYKNIALLGCPYKPLNAYMIQEGLHIVEHRHYYEDTAYEYTISNENLGKREKGFLENLYHRAYYSCKCLWDIKKLSQQFDCTIVNYSEDSRIDAFPIGLLE